MLPHCDAAITNALFPSSSGSSSSSSPGNPVLLAAFSLLFIFRNLSCLSASAARPPPVSFRPPRQTAKMRGSAAAPAGMTPSTGARGTAAGARARALAFSTPESLSDWLRHRLPSDSFASWGTKPGTKTVHNLWLELSLGETSLLLQGGDGHEDGGRVDPFSQQQPQGGEGLPGELSLLRTVHVATVKIRNASGAMLVETHQLLSDGTIRSRRRPLSEKMKPGESVEEAASRAVQEELGSEAKVRIVPGTYETRVEEKASVSYPGLPAQYVLHSVDAEVEGVPQDGEFSTEEAGERFEASSEVSQKAVFVQRHFWKWVHDDVNDDSGSTIPLG